ncbi:MAG TPA: hypothetical protein VGH37_19930 [Candidatus Acidoferrum sp.]|jgi:hypothetical protein
MRTVTLPVAVIAVLLAGFAAWCFARKTNATAQMGSGQPLCSSQIPSSWGEYKGGSQQSGFAFEDSNGTLRFITNVPCDGTPQVALEIRRVKDK